MFLWRSFGSSLLFPQVLIIKVFSAFFCFYLQVKLGSLSNYRSNSSSRDRLSMVLLNEPFYRSGPVSRHNLWSGWSCTSWVTVQTHLNHISWPDARFGLLTTPSSKWTSSFKVSCFRSLKKELALYLLFWCVFFHPFIAIKMKIILQWIWVSSAVK